MDLEEIKKLILKYKKIIIIILAVGGIIFLWQKNQSPNVAQNDFNVAENSDLKGVNKKDTSTPSSQMSSSEEQNNKPQEVTCDISGAVKKQGVYTLKSGARLEELIQAAGGLKQNAQIKAINRAQLLKDQDKIHIPYKGEKVEAAPSSVQSTTEASSSSSGQKNGEKVNLNTASASDLQKLNGIGAKKAEQIISYREEKGQFKKIEDLMQVSGIGEKTFAALKDQLEV